MTLADAADGKAKGIKAVSVRSNRDNTASWARKAFSSSAAAKGSLQNKVSDELYHVKCILRAADSALYPEGHWACLRQ